MCSQIAIEIFLSSFDIKIRFKTIYIHLLDLFIVYGRLICTVAKKGRYLFQTFSRNVESDYS